MNASLGPCQQVVPVRPTGAGGRGLGALPGCPRIGALAERHTSGNYSLLDRESRDFSRAARKSPSALLEIRMLRPPRPSRYAASDPSAILARTQRSLILIRVATCLTVKKSEPCSGSWTLRIFETSAKEPGVRVPAQGDRQHSTAIRRRGPWHPNGCSVLRLINRANCGLDPRFRA